MTFCLIYPYFSSAYFVFSFLSFHHRLATIPTVCNHPYSLVYNRLVLQQHNPGDFLVSFIFISPVHDPMFSFFPFSSSIHLLFQQYATINPTIGSTITATITASFTSTFFTSHNRAYEVTTQLPYQHIQITLLNHFISIDLATTDNQLQNPPISQLVIPLVPHLMFGLVGERL